MILYYNVNDELEVMCVKLNNNGWGYRDMIIYSSIILIALIIVAVSISSFYDDLSNSINNNNTYKPNSNVVQPEEEGNSDNTNTTPSTNTNYYVWLESQLKSATLDYLNTYSYDLTDNIMNVSLDTLVSFGFIEQLYDQSGNNICSGYSNVFITTDGQYEIKPFINCSNYVTSGY